jgi:hypothetical protein
MDYGLICNFLRDQNTKWRDVRMYIPMYHRMAALLIEIIVLSGDTSYYGVKVTSVCIMCIFLVNIYKKCWCLLKPSSAFTVIVWDNLVWVHTDFEECFVVLRMISVHFTLENCFELHIDDSIYWFNYVIFVESVSTSESMISRPCFQALYTVSF